MDMAVTHAQSGKPFGSCSRLAVGSGRRQGYDTLHAGLRTELVLHRHELCFQLHHKEIVGGGTQQGKDNQHPKDQDQVGHTGGMVQCTILQVEVIEQIGATRAKRAIGTHQLTGTVETGAAVVLIGQVGGVADGLRIVRGGWAGEGRQGLAVGTSWGHGQRGDTQEQTVALTELRHGYVFRFSFPDKSE